jgi:predicted 2-oxoglutarate/Fe(II)-dependent dioxygenase YbiX
MSDTKVVSQLGGNLLGGGGTGIWSYDNFLSKEECDELIKFFNANQEEWRFICFYGSYGMHVVSPFTKEHGTSITEEYMANLRARMIQYVSDAAGRPMKINSMHAQKWELGAYANDHSDSTDLDGNDMGWSDNKQYAGIYLNSHPDYSGGVLKFRDHGIDVVPATGTFVSFPGGPENIHSVTEITGGTRYTIVIFWDYADSWYSEAELQEMEALIMKERIHQYQLKNRWRLGEAHPLLEDPYTGLDDDSKLPEGFKESLTTADMKSNARRNQENAVKEGRVPEGVINDMIIKEEVTE